MLATGAPVEAAAAAELLGAAALLLDTVGEGPLVEVRVAGQIVVDTATTDV